MDDNTTRASACQTLSLVELCDNDLKTCIEPSIFLPSEISSKVSESQQNHDGNISQGIMWQPLRSRNKKHQTQIMLLSTSFKKIGISDSHLVDSYTQTCHFNYTVIEPSKYNEAENLDEENEKEEGCVISGCNFKRNIEENLTMLYRIKCQGHQNFLINEALEFHMPEKLMKRQYLFICSKHFVTNPDNFARKSKVSKALANIPVTNVSNRPRRRPKPNRAYDWAEVDLPRMHQNLPRIHSEPSEKQSCNEIDEEPVYHRNTRPRGAKRKNFSSKQKKTIHKAMKGEGIFFSKQDIQEFQTDVHHSNVYLQKVLGMEADADKMVCDASVQCTVIGAKANQVSTVSDGTANIDWQRLYEMLSITLEELGPENACHPRISACLNSFLKDTEEQENCQNLPTSITILKLLTYGLMKTKEKSNNIYVVSEHTDEEELEIRIQDAFQTMGGPISSIAGSSLSKNQYQVERSHEVTGSQEKPKQKHKEAYEIHNLNKDSDPNIVSNEDIQEAIEEVYDLEKRELPNSQILRTFANNEAIKKKRLRMSLSQKKDLCLLKEEYPTITHENLGRVFQDQWGFTVSKSTVRDILKEKDKWLAVTDKDIEAEVKSPKHKTVTPWIRQKLCQYKNENTQITIDELILWAKDNLDMILDESIATDILRFDQMWRNLISQTSDSMNNIQNQESTNYFEENYSNKGKLLKVSIKQKQDLCLLKEECPNIPFEKLGKIFADEWGFTISKTAAREIYRDKDKWLSTNPQNTWRTRSKPPSSISAEQKMALCQLHEEFPFITREEIAKIFNLEWGIDICLSTISGILKDKAKWLQFDED